MARRTPLLAVLSLIPVLLNAVAVLFLLPDTVPLHIGFGGTDSYGSKYMTFVVGGLMTAFSFLFTLLYYKAEKLADLGLIHSANVKGARISLLAAVVFLDLLSLVVLLFWLS